MDLILAGFAIFWVLATWDMAACGIQKEPVLSPVGGSEREEFE